MYVNQDDIKAPTGTNRNITFIDVKKVCDSVDTPTVVDTLEELRVDKKTKELIHHTFMNTASKVRFLGEISELLKCIQVFDKKMTLPSSV